MMIISNAHSNCPNLPARGRPRARFLCRFLLAVVAVLVAACDKSGDGSDKQPEASALQLPVVVYSAIAEQLIQPIFDAYTVETGVPVRYVIDGEQALVQKLLVERDTTRADLLLAVDASNLWYAAEKGVLRPTYSEILDSNIPPYLRDPEQQWFAVSVRARTIVYDTRSVDASDLEGYAGLADEKWSGKLCLETSTQVHNQSLVASLIFSIGAREAELLVRGWMRNLATDVFANDTQLIDAIVAGQCQVGIVDTHNLGHKRAENADIPVAIFWPTAESGAVHVNVSGAGVTRHARNPEGAVALLEWMSGDEAQRLLVGASMEYPSNPAIPPNALMAGWGTFEASEMNVAQEGYYQADAVKLMERAGYR